MASSRLGGLAGSALRFAVVAAVLQPPLLHGQTKAEDPVEAVRQGTGAKPGDIVIEFRGGLVADNLTAILGILLDVPGGLETETLALGDYPGICEMLAARGYPPGCETLMGPVRRLNPGLETRSLGAKSQFMLPVISPTRVEGLRALSDVQARRVAGENKFNWSSDRQVERVLGQHLLRYTAYQLRIPTRDDAQADVILTAIAAKQLANVEIELAPRNPPEPPAFSVAEQSPPPCRTEPLLDYISLVDGDGGLEALTKLPDGSPAADVWLIDTALSATPDLPDESDLSPTAPAECTQVDFDRLRHHATHLAGIVASRNEVRFRGLAPTARVHSIPYLKPDPANPGKYAYFDAAPGVALKRQLEAVISKSGQRRPVFLVATSFPAKQSEIEAVRRSRQARSAVPPNNVFFDYRPIVIASAGQQAQRTDGSFDPDDTPLDKIASIYPNSPQNLGDLPNIVLVTACGMCTRNETHLLPSAYRPLPDTRSTIPLIAPGNQIRGWVGKAEISRASGTSQAAAYVAGVVAGMIARHDYADAWQLKYWLMATAWPLVDNGRHDPETIKAVGAGLVDPLRAWLDPSKHWVRLRGGNWGEVRLKRWSGRAIEVVSREGASDVVATSSIAHVVRVSGDDNVPSEYALLTLERSPTEFRKWDSVRFDSAVVIERCGADEEPIALEDIEELIMAIPRLTERADGCG